MQIDYEFTLPVNRQERECAAIIGLDGEGRPGLVSIEVNLGPAGFTRRNKGELFNRAEAYLRAVCWADVLLQFEIRRHEIAALIRRYEAYEPQTQAESARRRIAIASLRANMTEIRSVA